MNLNFWFRRSTLFHWGVQTCFSIGAAIFIWLPTWLIRISPIHRPVAHLRDNRERWYQVNFLTVIENDFNYCLLYALLQFLFVCFGCFFTVLVNIVIFFADEKLLDETDDESDVIFTLDDLDQRLDVVMASIDHMCNGYLDPLPARQQTILWD